MIFVIPRFSYVFLVFLVVVLFLLTSVLDVPFVLLDIPFSKQESRSIFLENHVLRIGGAHRAPLFIDVSKQVLRSISFDECVCA